MLETSKHMSRKDRGVSACIKQALKMIEYLNEKIDRPSKDPLIRTLDVKFELIDCEDLDSYPF